MTLAREIEEKGHRLQLVNAGGKKGIDVSTWPFV